MSDFDLFNYDTQPPALYQQYSPAPTIISTTNIEGAVIAPVTTIHGNSGQANGPDVSLSGGTTGYDFDASGSSITMVGAAKRIKELGGDVLDIGPIAPNDFLRRQGNQIVGDPAPDAAPLSIVSTTTDFALSDSNDVVLVNAGAAPVNVALHDPATAKQKYYSIKLIVAGNPMTITATPSTVDGAGSISTVVQYTSFTLVPNNATSQWFIV